jgi:serine/threonine-protein kinase
MERVGPYELIERLGRGGMGEVFLARDTRDGTRVALKRLDSRVQEDHDNFLERFRREGELLQSIHHRTLPVIYDVGVSDTGDPYLAMEHLQGEPLSRWIGASPFDTIPLLIQICHGLREIASRNIVHRDISPDNVLVVRQGRDYQIKIIDFGIAKEISRTTQLTSAGFFFGKLQYCSPEQVGMLEERETIDWRSDLYGFGVVAYHVLSGRLPFPARTPLALVGAHLHETPPLLEREGLAFPSRLTTLIARMLEKDRTRRPDGYHEVITELALSHAQMLLTPPGAIRNRRGTDGHPAKLRSAVPEVSHDDSRADRGPDMDDRRAGTGSEARVHPGVQGPGSGARPDRVRLPPLSNHDHRSSD